MDGDSDYKLEDWTEGANECWLMSLRALAVDWIRSEEDAAWAYLAIADKSPVSDGMAQP